MNWYMWCRLAEPASRESNTPTSFTACTRTPVSSKASRSTPAAGVSPTSSAPPGSAQW